MFRAVGDEIRTSLKFPFPPRRHYLDIRLQRIIRKFKTNLIVALAGRTVSDGISTFAPCDLDLSLCDNGRASEVPSR